MSKVEKQGRTQKKEPGQKYDHNSKESNDRKPKMTMRHLLQLFCLLALFDVVDSTPSTASRIDNFSTHAPQPLVLQHKDMQMFHPMAPKQDRQPPLSVLRALRGGDIALDEWHSIVRKVDARSVTPFIYLASLPTN